MTELEALAARHKLEAMQAIAETAVLERSLALMESPQPVAVPWSEYPAYDNWGMAPVGFQPPYIWTNPDDFAEGRCLPLYQNAQDVRRFRADARNLVGFFPSALGLLRKLSDYVIGTGWEFTVKPKKRYANNPAATALAASVQDVLDQHLEFNSFVGNLDREIHEQSRVDGDCFPTLYLEEIGRDKYVRIELTDPGCILEPAEKRPLERMLRTGHKLNAWWHGVHTTFHQLLKRDDVVRPLGYHAVYDRIGDQWDYLPANRVEHIKRNVPRLARVGYSDFKIVQTELEASAKVRKNTAEGAAILAAIVMWREHAEGTSKSSIERMVSDNATSSYQRNSPENTRTIHNERTRPGTVKDIPHGMTVKSGPLGTLNQPIYVEVEKHILRVAGNTWSMPEYMSTGDASNANYSSTLVAESPFVKYCEQEQAYYGGHYIRLHWKALKMHCDSGQLMGHSWAQISTMLDIDAEYKSPASRDQVGLAQKNQILHDKGILSKRTWAADEGLDLDEEIANGAKETVTPGFDPKTGAPLIDPNKTMMAPSPRMEALAAGAIAAIRENCGTGAGGFKGGNKCAGGTSGANATQRANGKLVTSNADGGGAIHAMHTGDTLKITTVEIPEESRGKGIGSSLYSDVIQYAKENKLLLRSDGTVEAPAVRVWQSLKRKGVPVIENPKMKFTPEGAAFVPGTDFAASPFAIDFR